MWTSPSRWGHDQGKALLDGILPPADALIAAYNVRVGSLSPYTASYDVQSGAYRIGGLPPGGYQVRAEASYLANYLAPVVAFYGVRPIGTTPRSLLLLAAAG